MLSSFTVLAVGALAAANALQICQLPNGAQLTCANSCCSRFEGTHRAYENPAYYCCDEESGKLVTEEPIASGLESSSTSYTALIIIGLLITIGLIAALSLLAYLLFNRMRRRGQIWNVEQHPKPYPAGAYDYRDYPPPRAQSTIPRPYIPREDYPPPPPAPAARDGERYAPSGPRDGERYVPVGPSDAGRYVPPGPRDDERHVPAGPRDAERYVPSGPGDTVPKSDYDARRF